MKATTILSLSVASILSISYAGDEKPAPEDTVVKVLDKPFPAEEDKQSDFLWGNFVNKPDESKFNSYGTENWKATYEIFAKALVKKAVNQKLDSASLRGALDYLLKDAKGKISTLPVGAYQTSLDGKLVWIITEKWELRSMGPIDDNLQLVHIRVFVFDQKTLKIVGFTTCG